MKKIQILGLEKIPIVREGDDIASLIVKSAESEGVKIEDGDIIVVSQKIISKAEGRIVNLSEINPSSKALMISREVGKDERQIEVILKECKRILKISRYGLVVEMKNGWICLNSGVNKSNVEGEEVFTLLPYDADKSARKIADEIKRMTGHRVGVIICDTSSRPLRRGQVNFAIGVAYVEPFKDYRGRKDLFGYELKVKMIAVIDEIASAAELVIGQADEGIPVAIIKGLKNLVKEKTEDSKVLSISREEDIFSGIS